MSINIKVKVDFGGLLEKIKLLQAKGRQSLLQAEEDRSVKSEVSKKRENNLKKDGKDSNGKSKIAGEDSQLSIDRRPGASRSGKPLPFFYLKIFVPEDSFSSLDERRVSIEVVSGDGSKSANADLEYGNPRNTGREISGGLEPLVGPWPDGTGVNNDRWTVYDDGDKISAYRGVNLVDNFPTEQSGFGETYDAEIRYDHYDRAVIVALPLGGGNSLMIVYRALDLLVWQEDRYTAITSSVYSDPNDPNRPPNTQTLNAFSHTTAIKAEERLIDYVAFKVGYTEAVQVQISEELEAALDALIPTTSYDTYSTTDYGPSCTEAPGIGNINVCIGYDVSATYDEYIMTENIETEVPQTWNSLYNGVSWDRLPSYGLVDEDPNRSYFTTTFTSTPASWFAIESYNNHGYFTGQLNPDFFENESGSATHEQILSLKILNQTLSSLLKPKEILGLPTDTQDFWGNITDMTDDGYTYKWKDSQNYMTGIAGVKKYEYSDEYWSFRGKKFKKGLVAEEQAERVLGDDYPENDPYAAWRRVVIHDWGRSDFCRQQAFRYSLTSLNPVQPPEA